MLSIAYSLIIILNSILIKNFDGSLLSLNILINIIPFIYIYGFGININYIGEYKKNNDSDNKIDILTCNHINALDFMIYLSVLRKYDDRNIYFIMKKKVIFIPGLGSLFALSNDIKLHQNIEDDRNNIENAINKIKNGIIIILPEGTRFSPEKQLIAKEYSQNNNLPVFNNTLYPKMKGLFLITNILKNKNKLGKIIDFTIYIDDKIKNKGHFEDFLLNNNKNSYCIINSYNIDKNVLNNYDDFKQWFLNIWKIKDNALDNINNYNYNKLIPKIKLYEIMVTVTTLSLFFHLIYISNGKYLINASLIMLLVSFIKYKQLNRIK
jgi:1-acyl-sn-glycerol-3-phosphate acyltransferase